MKVCKYAELQIVAAPRHLVPELKKVGSMGSTLPEHLRFSPGTHKVRNYLKEEHLNHSVKIARFINISLQVPVA